MTKPRRLATLALALVLASCGLQTGNTMDAKIDTRHWETHCFGRYLVDLPPGTRTSATYKFTSQRVKTLRGVSEQGFHDKIAKREAHLKSVNHPEADTLFVKETRFSPNEVLLTSWDSPNSKLFHLQQLYVHRSENGKDVLYVLEGETNPHKFDLSVQYYRKIAEAIHYRSPSKIPTGPGFCINYGFIANNRPNREEVSVSIGFKQYKSVTASMLIFPTSNPPKPLLDRMGGLSTYFMGILAQTTTLRKGDRTLGAQKGQEYLVRANEDGKTSYEFAWDSMPLANSMSHQEIGLELTTTDVRHYGHIIDAPFKDDEEALGFWDAILESFRLRPGSV